MSMRWTELIVTNRYGESLGNLGELVSISPSYLDKAVIERGRITEWPEFFLAAPGETADWNIPVDVDWDGFEEIVNEMDRVV